MAQQVLVEHALNVLHVSFTNTTVAGVDYLAVTGEELVFNPDDSRVCSTIHILQDSISEHDPSENFFIDLAYVSGVQPIIITQPMAQVVIDDSDEPECKCCIFIVHIIVINAKGRCRGQNHENITNIDVNHGFKLQLLWREIPLHYQTFIKLSRPL